LPRSTSYFFYNRTIIPSSMDLMVLLCSLQI
jgi:hypothetical protein